jgi:hypothetical protein
VIADFQFPISNCFIARRQSKIGNWQSAMASTHPLPRGGTDLIAFELSLFYQQH